MSTYKEQLQNFRTLYERETSSVAVTTHDVAAWAYERGLWKPRHRDVVDQLADELARAWREEYRTDELGRRYRIMHAVTSKQGAAQMTLWADIESAPRDHMMRAFAQRRQQIVGDCVQLRVDVDVYNDKNSEQSVIQLYLDFTDDVAELMQLHQPDLEPA